MVIVYILAALLAGYLLLLLVSALLVNPKKEYSHPSRLYRFLLNSATAAALKLMRIRVHVTGTEKLPKGQKILFVGNHMQVFIKSSFKNKMKYDFSIERGRNR